MCQPLCGNNVLKEKGKYLMDIQRPILYNPTNNKVEISVHILCIVSENIY